jgi:single-strand DNA-binding protein
MRSTASGKSVASFGIAVNRRVKSQDGDADFFTVTCWGQTADFVTNYLSKGRLIAVDGRLSWRKYTTSDGQTREVVEVVADNVQILDSRRDAEDDGGGATRTYGGGGTTQPAAPPADTDEYDPFADTE